MAIVPTALQPGLALTTIAAPLYTAPTNTRAVIKRAVFANGSAGPVSFGVTVQRAGVAQAGILAIVPSRLIAAGATDTAPELANFVFQPGDQLLATAGAAGINAFLSGFVL